MSADAPVLFVIEALIVNAFVDWLLSWSRPLATSGARKPSLAVVPSVRDPVPATIMMSDASRVLFVMATVASKIVFCNRE